MEGVENNPVEIPSTLRKCPSHIWNDFSFSDINLYKFIIPSIGKGELTSEKLKLLQNILFCGCFTTSLRRQNFSAH